MLELHKLQKYFDEIDILLVSSSMYSSVQEIFNNNLPVKKTFRVKKSVKKPDKKQINLTATLEAKEKSSKSKEVKEAVKEMPKEEVEEMPKEAVEEMPKEEIDLEELVSKKTEKESISKKSSTTESKDTGGLEAEELNLGDDLEELQSMFKEEAGDEDVFRKLSQDLGNSVTEEQIREKMAAMKKQAKDEIMNEI